MGEVAFWNFETNLLLVFSDIFEPFVIKLIYIYIYMQLKSIKPPFRVNIYVSFLAWSHDGYLFFRLIFFYGTFKFLIQSWPGLGIRSSVIWANRSVFAKKWANERFARKNKRFTHSLIFGEQPERFAHGCSFLVRDLSNLLTSLIFGEQPERFAHIPH